MTTTTQAPINNLSRIFAAPLDLFTTIQEVQAHLAGHWTIEMVDGTTFRANSITPLGKSRTQRGQGWFEVHCIGVQRKGTPSDKLDVLQFEDIASATKIEVDHDAIAARIAARRAAR